MGKINRVFVTGDKHGEVEWLADFCSENLTSTKDIVIILGDSALRFEGINSEREKARKKFVSKCPITVFALRGNHDRPYFGDDIKLTDCELLDSDTKMWHDKEYPNIWYFQDGGIYKIKDKTFFTYGGAYSVDMEYRLKMHWTWYPDEMVNDKEHREILSKTRGKHFDFILTHTCPLDWIPTYLFLPFIDQSSVNQTMERRLTEIYDNIKGYSHWYWGHYHADENYGKLGDRPADGESRMFYNEIEKVIG